jgi:prepilin-type processing-associated H-X9-DG protein
MRVFVSITPKPSGAEPSSGLLKQFGIRRTGANAARGDGGKRVEMLDATTVVWESDKAPLLYGDGHVEVLTPDKWEYRVGCSGNAFRMYW